MTPILLRIILTILFLWFISIQVEWPSVIEIFLSIKWWWVIVAILLQVIIFIIGAIRWRVFFYHGHSPYTLRQLIKPYFIGALFNNFLPASTGGDALRIYHVYKQGYGYSLAFSPIVVERAIGTSVMFGMASLIIPFIEFKAKWVQQFSIFIPVIFLSLIVLLSIIGCSRSYRKMHNFLTKKYNYKLIKTILKITKTIHKYLKSPTLILKIIALSVLAQFMEIVVFFTLAQSIDTVTPFSNFILAVPIILIITGLPISIGGFGIREIAIITIFSTMGMSNSESAAIALLFIPVLIIGSSPGLYFFLNLKNKRSHS
ncbi:flippase-like domain-containing protein [bacterium]|jgi:glycosyltransferase 2 family protein|nr:flippase-like domain-containing protein [bacterium]